MNGSVSNFGQSLNFQTHSSETARFDTIRTNVSARILLCRNIFANKSFGKYRAWSSCAHSVNISVTTLENIHQPLLLLARNLLGDSNLVRDAPNFVCWEYC